MNDSIVIPTDRFVYFDEEGEITAISNTKDIEGNFITVHLDEVMNFLTGKERVDSYLVVYDTVLKKHILKLKYYADDSVYKVDEDIFKVKKEVDKKPDLIITQDVKKKCWKFTVDEGLRDYLTSQTSLYSKNLQFSVTRKNDPHELYQLIIVNLDDLVKQGFLTIPFASQYEENNNDVSVYTTKRFETYLYEVKND